MRLSSVLKGKALQLYHSVDDGVAADYPQLKTALPEKFCLTAETYRTKLRKAKPRDGEIFKQFVARLSVYLTRWVDMAGKEKTNEDLTDLLLLEQFMSSVPRETATFIRERLPKTVDEAGEFAQIYKEANPHRRRRENTTARKLKTHLEARTARTATPPRMKRSAATVDGLAISKETVRSSSQTIPE